MKFGFHILWACSLLSIGGCAVKGLTSSPSGITTQYYYGEVTTTTPDGKIYYNPTEYYWVERIIDRQKQTIVERVVCDGKLYETTLQNPIHGNFEVIDSEGIYYGTVTFTDDNYDQWEYNLFLKDGSGRLTGKGNARHGGIKKEKWYYDQKEFLVAKISEDLHAVSAEAILDFPAREVANPVR